MLGSVNINREYSPANASAQCMNVIRKSISTRRTTQASCRSTCATTSLTSSCIAFTRHSRTYTGRMLQSCKGSICTIPELGTTKNVDAAYQPQSLLEGDSMEAEEPQEPRGISIAQLMRPCDEGQIDPLQTRRFERLCAGCQHARDDRLDALDSQKSDIRVKPWKWQLKYQGGSTPAQHKASAKGPNSYTIDGGTWAVTTTLSNLINESPSWMRDWKRQDASIVG